jgi:hypothetical protein
MRRYWENLGAMVGEIARAVHHGRKREKAALTAIP